MNKIEQAVYHALYQGFLNIDEEIQIPRLEGEALYNVFFKLRLDHPEIFCATGYKYKYYNDSPNLIFVPEYLFEKAKIKEHQKAMTARVEKIAREAKTFSQWDKHITWRASGIGFKKHISLITCSIIRKIDQ